ncbi:hypothetical protein [Actinocrispum wychmicini]|uniref:hypothetical protein n=1 Tax=Actinocrispum wychmicini TaxID=1213861 RepID=UPI001043C87D|nr:hypothetical protein [Actinocrispum wychmicini]
MRNEDSPGQVDAFHPPRAEAEQDSFGDTALAKPSGVAADPHAYAVHDLDSGAPARVAPTIPASELRGTPGHHYYLDRDNKPRECEITASHEQLPDGQMLIKQYDHDRPNGSWEVTDGSHALEFHHDYIDAQSGVHVIEDQSPTGYYRVEQGIGDGRVYDVGSQIRSDMVRHPDGNWERTTSVRNPDGTLEAVVERYDATHHEREIERNETDVNGHVTHSSMTVHNDDGHTSLLDSEVDVDSIDLAQLDELDELFDESEVEVESSDVAEEDA